MIHISVPSSQIFVEPNGLRKYIAYDLHVNGFYHSSIRYSELFQLHEILRAKFALEIKRVDFPPKTLFRNIDEREINERRIGLTHYFQNVMQYQWIANHEIVVETFRRFQVESFRPSSNCVSVDVYMADNSKESVRCKVDQPTGTVLTHFAAKIGLGAEHIDKFGLFVVRDRTTKAMIEDDSLSDYLCVRLLGNHESPYISLHQLNQKSASTGTFYRIMIKKLIWHKIVEEQLLDDPGAVFLLYRQTVSDLHFGRMDLLHQSSSLTSAQAREQLTELVKQNNFMNFLKFCYKLSMCSFELLEPCIVDYPQAGTNCTLKVGFRSVILEPIETTENPQREEYIYRVTRIRMWRLVHNSIENEFSLQFEYYLSKDNFQWITLITKQGVLLSLILQSMGSEIMRENCKQVTTALGNQKRSDSFGEIAEDGLAPSSPPSTNPLNAFCEEKNHSHNDWHCVVTDKESCEKSVYMYEKLEDIVETYGMPTMKVDTSSVSTSNDSEPDLKVDAFTTISDHILCQKSVHEITDDDL